MVTLAVAAGAVSRFASDHTGSERINAADGTSLAHASGFSFETSARTPQEAARAFLRRHGEAFGVTPQHSLRLAIAPPAGNAGAVRFHRLIDGLPIFGGDVVIGVDAKNRVFLVNSGPAGPMSSGRHVID